MAVKEKTQVRLQPLYDRIVVEPLDAEQITSSGLVIPDTAKEKQQRGRVVNVGKGRLSEDGKITPLEVKTGDEILYGKYSGTEFKMEGRDFLILREEDVLGIIK